MQGIRKIACVTGASGMVGRRIVEQLIQSGYTVRALNRRKWLGLEGVDVFQGRLEDETVLRRFVAGADYLYHCAAELKDESKMWAVNVGGTQRLVKATAESTISHFLYLSSAGVVGITNVKNVDESTPCNPVTTYEKTKWEAEKIVAQGIKNCSVVILRPTNIIDERQAGVLENIVSDSLSHRIAQFVRGGECAHIIHAKDVASVALHFNNKQYPKPESFFVSIDKDPLNTYAGIRSISKNVIDGINGVPYISKNTVPIFLPYILRKIRIGKSNWGDVKYASRKLKETGFHFDYNTQKAVSEILSAKFGFTINGLKPIDAPMNSSAIGTLVVIGASGFIGRNLVNTLTARTNLQIRVLIQKEANLSLFKAKSNITVFKGNLLRIETLEKLITPNCTVVNLAYMDNESQANNLLAIQNLSAVCSNKKIKRLVHCSTATVVGDTQEVAITESTACNAKADYDVTKLRIEEALSTAAKNNFELAILRPTSVFGPEGKDLIKLANNLTMKNWRTNFIRSCFSGRRSMNLVCLENVIGAIIFVCASNTELHNEVFIISDDNNPRNNYFDIEKALIKELELEAYPIPQIPLPGFFLSTLLKISRRPITQTRRYYSSEKLNQAGYEKSTSIQEELCRFAKWYKENGY